MRSRGGWLAWPLLVLTALPLLVVVVVARRVLSGDSALYGDLPGDLSLRDRSGLLLQVAGDDTQLLPPLVALAVLVWLARRPHELAPPRAALWCGAALAAVTCLLAAAQCAMVGYVAAVDAPEQSGFGLLGPRESLLEIFGPRASSALLLAALAGGLAVVLASLARQPEPREDALLDGDPAQPEPGVQPAPEVEPEPPDVAGTDPHARYRRQG